MALFTDGVQSTLERALDGVALRQRVTASNISNAMTPGYKAQRVEFEGALSDAIQSGSSADGVRPTVVGSTAPAREDGNNVELENEATGLMRSGLQFEALVQATSYRLSMLRSAMR